MTAPTLTGAPAGSGAPAPGSGPGPGPAPGSTYRRSGPRSPAVRRGLRMAAVLGAIVVVYAVIAAVVSRPSGHGYLDITSPHPTGTRALAEILRARGVTVTTDKIIPDRAGDPSGRPSGEDARTVLVTNPDLLTQADLDALVGQVQGGSDVVLVVPGPAVVDALGVPLDDGEPRVGGHETDPGCDLPEARVAGSTTLGDAVTFAPATDDRTADGGARSDGPGARMHAVLCYGDPKKSARLAVLTPTSSTGFTGLTGRLVLLGGSSFLTNDKLDESGNAALALGLLARHEQLTWVTPLPGGPDAVGGKTVSELLPTAFWVASLQLLVAVVALALWRGRRLGPPVPEPLPVLVRATETVEGRGRLYAAARARERAAEALRAGLRARLAERLGLAVSAGQAPDPIALVTSVADHTGRSPWEVGALLYGSTMDGPDHSGAPAGNTATGPGTTVWGPSGPIRYGAPVPGTPPGSPPGRPGWPGDPAGRQANQARGEMDDAALVRLANALDELDRQVGRR